MNPQGGILYLESFNRLNVLSGIACLTQHTSLEDTLGIEPRMSRVAADCLSTWLRVLGADDGDRTHYLNVGNVASYQIDLIRKGETMTRIPDFTYCRVCGDECFTVYCEECAKNAKCPHGEPIDECNACYLEADMAFDSNREKGR